MVLLASARLRDLFLDTTADCAWHRTDLGLRSRQVHPLLDSLGQPGDSLTHQEDVVAHKAPKRHGVDRSIEFREGVEHHALQACYAIATPACHVLWPHHNTLFQKKCHYSYYYYYYYYCCYYYYYHCCITNIIITAVVMFLLLLLLFHLFLKCFFVCYFWVIVNTLVVTHVLVMMSVLIVLLTMSYLQLGQNNVVKHN